MILRTLILGAALLQVTACGGDPAAPSAEQNAAMNEAGALLDEAPESLSEIDDSALRNQPDAVVINAP